MFREIRPEEPQETVLISTCKECGSHDINIGIIILDQRKITDTEGVPRSVYEGMIYRGKCNKCGHIEFVATGSDHMTYRSSCSNRIDYDGAYVYMCDRPPVKEIKYTVNYAHREMITTDLERRVFEGTCSCGKKFSVKQYCCNNYGKLYRYLRGH